MFFSPFFRQNFGGGGHDMGMNVGPFRADYVCYSAAFLPDRDRERLNVENGGKILLPQAALEQLVEQVNHIEKCSSIILLRCLSSLV